MKLSILKIYIESVNLSVILKNFRFGVCCVKIIDDDSNTDVNYNDTYLQNPDYPSSYGDEGSITYKVNKLSSGKYFNCRIFPKPKISKVLYQRLNILP